MRFLVKVVIVLAVVWCGAWAIGSFAIGSGIDRALGNLRAQGWEARADTSKGGFPFVINTQLNDVRVVNPVTAERFEMEIAQIKARPYWPGHVDIELPQTPIVFGNPTHEVRFTARDGINRLRLRPGTALELSSNGLTAGAWTLASAQAEVLRGDALLLVADQTARGSGRYDVTLAVDGLTLGDDLRRRFSLPPSLPEEFQTVMAKGAVVLDAPLDRSARQTPPKFSQVILDGAQIDWGGIALRAMGALDVDADGVPEGTIELQAKDWRNLLDLAEGAGVLPSDRRGQAELMFGLLASQGGSRDDLDLPLAFRDGRMSLGPLPLGRAPRFVLPHRQ